MIDNAVIVQYLPKLLKGALVSLQVASLSCLIGIILGTTLGILQTGKNKWVSRAVTFFVTVIRGTPMLIQIYIFFFVFPAMGLNIPSFWAAVIAIGINSSAYVSQIIRLGISSVHTGQIEAAQVLGFSSWQVTRYVVLPQAIRVVLPALGNELVTLIKDSSLASVIGVVELTKEGMLMRSATYDVITSFAAVGLIYLCMTTTLSLAFGYLEARMNAHVKN